MKSTQFVFAVLMFLQLFFPGGVSKAEGLVINEVMTNPVEGGEYSFSLEGDLYTSDWIEIYNAGDEAVDIQGLYLSNRCYDPGLWEIGTGAGDPPPIDVAPHGYKLIWCPAYFLGEDNDNNPIYILSYLFSEGEAMPEPFDSCSPDPSDDNLSCNSYTSCEK